MEVIVVATNTRSDSCKLRFMFTQYELAEAGVVDGKERNKEEGKVFHWI